MRQVLQTQLQLIETQLQSTGSEDRQLSKRTAWQNNFFGRPTLAFWHTDTVK